MYKVTVNGVSAYSDTAVYIKKAENGCYVPCGLLEAEGVCVKVLRQQDTEEGPVVALQDVVYSLEGKNLEGAAETATVAKVDGPKEIDTAEQVVNILLGGAT